MSGPRNAADPLEPLSGWRWWIGLAVGGAVGLFAFAGLLRDAMKTMPLVWLRWLVGLVLVHDFVLAPLVLLAGRRLRDRAPEAWRWPVRLGLITSGVLVLASVPVLVGVGRGVWVGRGVLVGRGVFVGRAVCVAVGRDVGRTVGVGQAGPSYPPRAAFESGPSEELMPLTVKLEIVSGGADTAMVAVALPAPVALFAVTFAVFVPMVL